MKENNPDSWTIGESAETQGQCARQMSVWGTRYWPPAPIPWPLANKRSQGNSVLRVFFISRHSINCTYMQITLLSFLSLRFLFWLVPGLF